MMTMKNAFTVDGKTYEMNEKGNRFFVSDPEKKICRKRIGESTYELAWEQYLQTAEDNAQTDEWQNEADTEIEDRKQVEEKKDREAEDNFNGKKAEPKTKKTAKPRRPKDVAFEMDTLIGHITLTAKQVDFLKTLPKTSFWEEGIDSVMWCDCIADDIGWNPMGVGAMISTLREKNLVAVEKDMSRQGHPKVMSFTEVGQVVAKKLGLK